MAFFFFFEGEGSPVYASVRKAYVKHAQQLIAVEKEYSDKLIEGLSAFYLDIERDFNEASRLGSYWKRYAPRQRGRGFLNEAYPWGEVGEKVLDAYLYRIADAMFPKINYVGLPYGHDVRFLTEDAFVHIDIKSTGPHDNLNEVVSSPNQVSGDGIYLDDEGVYNSPIEVEGPRRGFTFQPELPPFYIIDERPRLTLTFYLKCAYDVISMGEQPLMYVELICVPNGLLMFDTLNYSGKPGLLIPGKDILTSVHKRTRIRLEPLAAIDHWRCTKIYREGDEVKKSMR